jgi:hypothetical protein
LDLRPDTKMETRRKEKEKKNAFYFSSRKEKPIKK